MNFSTQLRRIIGKAGHKPWDRLLQNPRASCETDRVERYPARAVATWLGHSPKVAAEHFLMSGEHHFTDVVNRGGTGSVDSAEGPQKMTKPAATTGVTAGSAGIAPITKTGQMGDKGLEPLTPSLSSWCSNQLS